MPDREDFPLVWRVKTRLPERFGQRCRIDLLAKSLNSCLVIFEDGFQVVTSRNYVRRPKKKGDPHGDG